MTPVLIFLSQEAGGLHSDFAARDFPAGLMEELVLARLDPDVVGLLSRPPFPVVGEHCFILTDLRLSDPFATDANLDATGSSREGNAHQSGSVSRSTPGIWRNSCMFASSERSLSPNSIRNCCVVRYWTALPRV